MLAADGGEQHLRDADRLMIERPVAAVDDASGIGAIEDGADVRQRLTGHFEPHVGIAAGEIERLLHLQRAGVSEHEGRTRLLGDRLLVERDLRAPSSGLELDPDRPGTRFNYSTGETDLAGVVLRAAIGNNLATYLAHKIWTPMMESPAYWMTHGAGGGERGGCCLYATLRDYGRLAEFVLNEGALPDGTRVLPPGWIKTSTTPTPATG